MIFPFLLFLLIATPTIADTKYSSFIDEITRITHQVDQKKISACTGFSYLFQELYKTNNLNFTKTLQSAPYLLATGSSVFRRLTTNSKYLKKVFPDAHSKLLTFILNSLTVDSTIDILTKYSDENWKHLTESGRSNLLNSDYKIPAWLIEHGGIDPRKKSNQNQAISTEKQGLENGYIQFSGDPDKNGRHDHLLANIILGFVMEKTYLQNETFRGFEKAYTRNDFSLENTFLFYGSLLHKFDPQNLKYDAFEKSSGYLEEYLSKTQNHSATDAYINRQGQRIGVMFGRTTEIISAKVLNIEVYQSICNEDGALVEKKGPIGR